MAHRAPVALARGLLARFSRVVLAGSMIAALFAVVGGAPAAHAATCDTSWTNGAGGDWNTAANWSSGVPDNTKNACVTLNGTYTVTLNATVSALSLTLGGTTGTQTLSIQSLCGNFAQLSLGADSTIKAHGVVNLTDNAPACGNYSAHLSQSAGTLTNSGQISVLAGTAGTDRLLDGALANKGTLSIGFTLHVSSTGVITNTGSVNVATGTSLAIANGSFLNNAGTIAATGTGSVSVENGSFTQGAGTTTGTAPVLVHFGALHYAGTGASTITQYGNSTAIDGNIAAGQTLNLAARCGDSAIVNAAASWSNAGTINLNDTTTSGCGNYDAELNTTGTLTNTGTVDIGANPSGSTSRIVSGTIANSGTITVEANATSNGSTITNTGTFAVANGTTFTLSNGAFLDNAGTVKATGTGQLLLSGSAYTQGAGTTSGNGPVPVLVHFGALHYTGAGASKITQYGNATTIDGNIASVQTLNLAARCGDSAVITAAASWSNAGTINLNDTTTGGCGNYDAELNTTGTLTNTGTVDIGANPLGSTSRDVNGNVANSGTIKVEASATNNGGTITNTGTFAMSTGATFTESNGAFLDNAGTVKATGTGQLFISGSAYTQGAGTTSGSSTVPVLVHFGAIHYTGTAASAITQYGNATTIDGNIAAGQTLNLAARCGDAAVLNATASWTNAGAINLSDTAVACGNYMAEINTSTGTLTNTGTIHVLAGNTERDLFGNIANSGTLTVNPTTQVNATITNTGTVTIANGAVLSVNNGAFLNNAGTLSAAGTGELFVNSGSFTQGGGTTSGTATAPVLVHFGSLHYTGTGSSTITQYGNATAIDGNIAAGQTLNLVARCGDAAVITAGTSWTNAGTINVNDNAVACGNYNAGITTSSGTLTNTGTIHYFAGNTDRNLNGTFVNSGTLVVDAGANVQRSGSITNTSTGTIEEHIASATSFGKISGSGAVNLDGTLAIVSTFTPAARAKFTFISGGGETGKFATITGQAVAGGQGFAVRSKPSGTTLQVVKAADLQVTGSAPDSVASGSQFSYSYTVTNAGPNKATSVTLSDNLPGTVTFVSASAGCTNVTGNVTCALGDMANGASVIVTITVTAGATSRPINTATATASTVDLTPADASAGVKVRII